MNRGKIATLIGFSIVFLFALLCRNVGAQAQEPIASNHRVKMMTLSYPQICQDSTEISWALHNDTLDLVFKNQYLKFYEISAKEFRDLHREMRIELCGHELKVATNQYHFRDNRGNSHLIQFKVYEDIGVITINVSEYYSGTIHYKFIVSTKNMCPEHPLYLSTR
jgi:hypothetical protein